jgi:hypothetical protein
MHVEDSKSEIDLALRIKNLISRSYDTLEFNESDESTSLILRNEWVEILLTRRKNEPEFLAIDAEISLPNSPEMEDKQLFPLYMIAHMEYLQNLQSAGFKIRVVGDECLWIASKEFKETVDDDVIEILKPPTS